MGAGLNDYFSGATRDLVKRGQLLLGKIPSQLPREFHLLAQKCRSELRDTLDALKSLDTLPQPERYREFQRLVQDIDLVEAFGIAVLNRANQDDRHLNIFIGRITHEINYPLLPPVVTLLSHSYFYIWPPLNILAIPLGESESLLHLPDLYHELAHPFVDERYDPRVQPFRRGLVRGLRVVSAYIKDELERELRGRGPENFKIYLQTWLKAWTENWIVEFFCDLFATYTLGPAFAWAHLHLCAKRGSDP